ncbi:MAG: hypothetical protein ACR2KX_01250 [Chitinophagaceae bacterium]
MDDLYLGHEELYPLYLHIDDRIIYLIYFSYALYFLIKFRKIILQTEYLILFSSILLLSLSLLIDVIHDDERFKFLLEKIPVFNTSKYFRVYLEDILKGMGISTRLLYFCRVTLLKCIPSEKFMNTGTIKK